jgi:hypothetical protein
LFSDGSRYKFLSDNIFDFIKNISYYELERIGYGIDNYTLLYKKWGEDFWRVKEEKSE